MNKRRLIMILSLIIIWQACAMMINKEVLIPWPSQVFAQMISDLGDPSFYQVVFVTLVRVIKGLLLAVSLAMIIGLSSAIYPKVADYFSVINDIIKSIPNISYIIIILIWLGSEASVVVVTFFIIFPNLYANILLGIDSLADELKDVMIIYPEKPLLKLKNVYLPQVYAYLLSGIKVAFGLGFKVSVMAEILSQVKYGIGKQIYYARNMLDMTTIISWTLWIIVIALLIDHIFDQVIKYQKKNN